MAHILYFSDDSDDMIFTRLLVWHIKFKKCKPRKKKLSEELMPVAWYPKRWWNFCISKDKKKKEEAILTE